MSIDMEGTEAPTTADAQQALAELQKEAGEVTPPAPEPEKEPEKAKEEPPKVEPLKEDISKPDRTPTMVPAWKLKVAEDQKEAALKAKTELEQKLDEVTKQKAPATQNQSDEIEAVIKEAEESGVDTTYLRKFADAILKKAGPSEDLQKTLNEIKQKEALDHELNEYAKEFEKDVLPLVREKYQLSDAALSELKEQLKGFAFSEAYAKVPLSEIFQIKESTLGLQAPKKSSEGKGPKGRATDVMDLENLNEEDLQKLPDDKILEISERKTSGWNTHKR